MLVKVSISLKLKFNIHFFTLIKKAAAILLVGILFFNWFGYRLLNSFLQDRANALLELRLDNNNYDESQLISIKIPANLPYYTNSQQYDRVDGQISINGNHYNYVKRRLFNDSLEYLCIPSEEKTRLSNARDEFFKLVNDLQHPQNKKQGNNSIAVKNLLAEYCQHMVSYCFEFDNNIRIKHHFFYYTALLKPSLSFPGQPPDVC